MILRKGYKVRVARTGLRTPIFFRFLTVCFYYSGEKWSITTWDILISY
jgi:hypothetical protein